MTQMPTTSGIGIDRNTGRVLSGWPHVAQSLAVIFSTQIGERVMRRWFGSDVPVLLGRNLIPPTILSFWTAICIAIELWEPRFRVTRIAAVGTDVQLRAGQIGFQVTGQYRPNALRGDFTPAGIRTLVI